MVALRARLARALGMHASRIVIAVSLLELLVHTATAEATTLVLMRTAVLARAADRAVLGRVIATEARWSGRRIVTRVQLRPEARDVQDLWFEHAGGTVDGLTMRVIGMPEFRPGDRAVVLLAERAGALHLVGLGEGKLDVAERDGQTVVHMRVRDGGPREPVPLTEAHAALRRATLRP